MPISYDLSALDPASFEHMVNLIAMKVLGAGHTGFGPGPDGGRDGFFEGEAPYPSSSEQWSGVWYIQSKFHRPHLSTDSQQWLLSQINNEIKEFSDTNKRRIWPDNWIIATNIDPSGAPNTGSFDKARSMVREANPHLVSRFHIWGGAKILSFLAIYPDIAKYYLSLITPGQVLASMYEGLTDSRADVTEIIRYLVVREFSEQQYTKLEQAGSTTDNRPGIQRLFTDLPVVAPLSEFSGLGAVTLARASAQNHRIQRTGPDGRAWRVWLRHPSRARVWFIRGGPGQGKSTLTQYICQIHRAALILDKDGPRVLPPQAELAREVKSYSSIGLWPIAPRIPIYIELKDFAQWFGRQGDDDAHGVLSYLATRISAHLSQPVLVGTLKRAFGTARWLLIFDGLDEVPGDVKDGVAKEVTTFIDDVLVGCDADALSVCTSRPQGYSDQFAALDAASIQLLPLSPEQALACAKPILEIDRSIEESRTYFEVLKDAMNSPAIRDIMTTPLQSHIMAVVVRDGGRPPERKWLLYNNFYQVIKKREANKQFNNKRLSALLREGDTLLKNLHNRLGFELHFRAEVSTGAQTSLTREELSVVVSEIVSELQDADVEETIQTLMEATTDRLVLVTTPESGESVRFDIRPLQEFFAGEYVYESATGDKLPERLRIIAGDPHWREVMHSLLSALVESGRRTEVSTAVQALIELNEGDEAARGLNRRMAVGGSIAARLLTEGVLDQDKRIRQQFSGSIAPLCGCTDAFRVLSSVKRLHSREWLIVQLVNSLKEQSHPENIGAASVLARILPDDHGLVSEVIRGSFEF